MPRQTPVSKRETSVQIRGWRHEQNYHESIVNLVSYLIANTGLCDNLTICHSVEVTRRNNVAMRIRGERVGTFPEENNEDEH